MITHTLQLVKREMEVKLALRLLDPYSSLHQGHSSTSALTI